MGEKTEEEKEEEHSEVNHLCEEASMPIEAVIAKLASGGGGVAEAAADEVVAGSGGTGSGSNNRPESNAMRRLKDEKKPTSPFLRAKPGPLGLLQGPKHIHFNEDGSERKNGDSVEGEQESKTDEIKEEEEKVEAVPATPVN